MKVKAFAAYQPGLRVEPYAFDIPGPRAHEVLVRVTHCSIGRGDVGFLRNDYGIADLKYPLVAGHELVGVVESAGDKVSAVAVGDRVGVGYQVWSCGTCAYCALAQENLCQQQACLVMHRPGGLASHMVVDERFVFQIPAGLESAEAAPLFCSGLTVYAAVKKAGITRGMAVGVVGVGGLGHFGVQLLGDAGAEVTAFSSKRDHAAIKRLGAARVVPYESSEVAAQTFDRLFVATHAHIDYDYYLNRLKPAGELWVVGVDANKTTFSSWLLNDLASRSIRGSYIGSPAEMRELLALAVRRHITGKTKSLPVRQLNDALHLVSEGNEEFRVVAEMEA